MTDIELSFEMAEILYPGFKYGISKCGKFLIEDGCKMKTTDMWFWGKRDEFVRSIRRSGYYKSWVKMHKINGNKRDARSRVESLLMAVRLCDKD
jgi:hypothetical protein